MEVDFPLQTSSTCLLLPLCSFLHVSLSLTCNISFFTTESRQIASISREILPPKSILERSGSHETTCALVVADAVPSSLLQKGPELGISRFPSIYLSSMHSSLSVIKDWNDSPNGLFAFNCDFPSGADLRQVASIGDDCSQFCAETDRCTHYTWRPSAWYQWPFGGAGVCFMKSGSISIFDAQPSNDNQVCGLINPQNQHQPVNSPISWINSPNGPYSFNCDFVGGDYIVVSKTKVHEECAQLCEKNQPCSHYAWAPLNDGTCWLKNGTTTASMAVASSVDQIVCGLLKSTSNPTETTSSSVAPFQTSNSISWIDSVNGPYRYLNLQQHPIHNSKSNTLALSL